MYAATVHMCVLCVPQVYVSPITARISWGRRYFTPGPFNLGWWTYPCGIISTLWAIFATVVFCLPIEMPVTAENLNYAAMAFIGTCTISIVVFYFPFIGAYKWFKGPAHTVEDDSAHIMTVVEEGKAVIDDKVASDVTSHDRTA